MIEFWHLFTGLGAGLAILNTAFLIFDRLFRYRPIVSVTAERGMGGGGHAVPTLRLKNVAPFDVVVERFTVKPPHLAVSANTEIRGILDAVTRTDVPILLGPEEERHLVVVVRDRANLRANEAIVITVEWRRGLST